MHPHSCRHDAVLAFGRHHIRHAQQQGKLTIPLQSKQVRCCCVLRVGLLPHHRCLPRRREALPLLHSAAIAARCCWDTLHSWRLTELSSVAD